MTGGGEAAPTASRFGRLSIVAVALAAMLPELAFGLSLSDSFVFNAGWGEQFRDLFRAGQLYPRWLPNSWGGAGSPTFYFYPPLFFWTAAAVDALSLQLLPAWASVSLASGVILAGSGLAMRAWLIARTGPRAATVAAIAYMLTPYHLFDIYSRGALAEAAAYLFVPLLLIGLRRIADRRGAGLALTAAAWGGLLLAHLPLALLGGVTLVPAYALFRLIGLSPHERARFIVVGLAAAALGTALAAAYLLPALTLLPQVSTDGLTGPYFRPDIWFVWRLAAWPSPTVQWLVPPLSLGVLLLASAVWRGAAKGGEARFWAALAAALVLLLLGVFPWFWSLPLVSQAQFPWRLFVLVDFALLTALALALPRRAAPLVRAAMLPLGVAAVATILMIADGVGEASRRFDTELASVRAGWRDAPEYLPRGTPLPLDERGRPLPVAIRPPAGPLVVADDPRARIEAAPRADGGIVVTLDAPAPTRLVARRHHFPHWRLTDESGRPIALGAVERRPAWNARPGRHVYRLAPGAAPWEREGRAISLAALLLILLLALAAWRRDKSNFAR